MIIFIFVIGLVFGSFMNVLVRRIPAGESIMPRSHCPHCGKLIRWFSNIPVLSFVLQKGHCRSCGGRISLAYPALELGTALLFCLIFLQSESTISAIKYCNFAFILVAAAATDVYTARSGKYESGMIPDIYTIGGVLCGYIWAIWGEPGFLHALAGSGAGYFVIMIPAFIYSVLRNAEGIGEGDALMLAMAGSFLGVRAMPAVVLLSALIGLLIGLIVIVRTKNIRYKVPFAPAIAAASLLWVFFADKISAYIGM